MALCGVYPLKEAAGCVDGIAHSFFNYVSPADYHTVDWFEWCAPRVWSPTCFRNAFQYGPVSYPRLTQCTHTPHCIRADFFSLARAHCAGLHVQHEQG